MHVKKGKKKSLGQCSGETKRCLSSSVLAAWEHCGRVPRRPVALTLEPLTQNALQSLVFVVAVPAGRAAHTDPARFHWLRGLLLEWLTAVCQAV